MTKAARAKAALPIAGPYARSPLTNVAPPTPKMSRPNPKGALPRPRADTPKAKAVPPAKPNTNKYKTKAIPARARDKTPRVNEISSGYPEASDPYSGYIAPPVASPTVYCVPTDEGSLASGAAAAAVNAVNDPYSGYLPPDNPQITVYATPIEGTERSFIASRSGSGANGTVYATPVEDMPANDSFRARADTNESVYGFTEEDPISQQHHELANSVTDWGKTIELGPWQVIEESFMDPNPLYSPPPGMESVFPPPQTKFGSKAEFSSRRSSVVPTETYAAPLLPEQGKNNDGEAPNIYANDAYQNIPGSTINTASKVTNVTIATKHHGLSGTRAYHHAEPPPMYTTDPTKFNTISRRNSTSSINSLC